MKANTIRFVVIPMALLVTGASQWTQAGGTTAADARPPSGAGQERLGAETPRLILYDRFEYEVKRDELNPKPAFLTEGQWSWVKSQNSQGRGDGWLYTTGRIPGYQGKFTGHDSRRVLAIEARPGTFQTQTDFYLQFGDPRGPADQVPANVWFQFWMYINHYDDPEDKEDQLSGFERGDKWIYPSVDGGYPTWPVWLLCIGRASHVRLPGNDRTFWAQVPSPELLWQVVTGSRDENRNFCAYAEIKHAPDWDKFKLGQTSLEAHLVANRWTLVKFHADTSTSSGTVEMWLKPIGQKWVKVMEWKDGVTPDFSWKLPEQKVGGHRVFRMPTTIGSVGERAKNNQDCWIYLDDFAMASGEEALPTYPD